MANWAERLAGRYGLLLHRRRRWILGAALLLGLLCVPPSVSILSQLDTNILNQVSERLPRFRALKNASEEFGGDVLAAVVVARPADAARPGARDEICRFGEMLACQLSRVGLEPEDQEAFLGAFKGKENAAPAEPWLSGVECRMGAVYEQSLLRLLRKYPQVTLDETDLNDLRQRFDPDTLRARLKQIRQEIQGLDPLSLERQRLAADPLRLGDLAGQSMQRHLQTRGQNLPTDGGGYLLSGDGTTLLVVARPARSSHNMAFNRVLMEACQRATERAMRAFSESAPKNAPAFKTCFLKTDRDVGVTAAAAAPQFHVGFTGMHAMAVENEHALRWDIGQGALTSTLSVLILLFIFLRSLQVTRNIGLTILLAALVTLATTWLIHGPIGVMGAAFTSILIGMGVDYGIILHGCYYELRVNGGCDSETAIQQTLMRKGPALLICSLTTSMGFLGVSLLDFRALAELGLLAGIGMLASAALMVLVYPALMLASDRGEASRIPRALPLGFVSLGRFLASKTGRYCGVTLGAAILAACVGLLVCAPPPQPGMERVLGVRFDPDLGNLRSLHSLTATLRDWVVEKFGGGLTDIRVIAEGADEAQALAASEAVQQRVAPFMEKGEIASSQSLVTMLPGLAHQDARLKALNALNLDECTARFKVAADTEFGRAAERFFTPFYENLKQTEKTLGNAKELHLADLQSGVKSPLLDRYVRVESAGRVRLVTYMLPSHLLYSEEWCRQLAQAIETPPVPGGGKVFLTAGRFVGYELKQSVIHDMLWIFAVVALQVTLVVLLPLRSLTKTILVMLPTICSVLFVLGGISLAERTHWGLSLNFINIMIFPILMGSAEDYGIYMVLEAYAGRRPPLSEVMGEMGRSLFLCCMTTLFGFGTMIFGVNLGLISFGWTCILGYVGALLCALLVLPAILASLGLGREREGAPAATAGKETHGALAAATSTTPES